MNIVYSICLSVFIICISCNSAPEGPTYDLKGFITENIGNNGTYAHFPDQNNWPLSSGHVVNGQRNGSWITYHQNSTKIRSVTSYVNGMKNGPEINLNDRGTIETVTNYRNDQLHGLSGKYRNSRTISEMTYANGILNGAFSVYDENNGKIQRSGFFKNGKQDGELLFYDGDGNITIRYQYKDGEKMSGGIIDKETGQ